ncbi:hypothetical protein NEMIN01_0402 [Nematocida minor]|uniref:uncharacterized protein n=1 Tax=Nematocida minor TaxID=1912983 RepID=UPI002220DE26|nr:uncharacterized protein NEMIN01_0402 [Nematocida minor]KAI5189236.1 hypothetical protein NEMIN01_0402 [Nematocida minor]
MDLYKIDNNNCECASISGNGGINKINSNEYEITMPAGLNSDNIEIQQNKNIVTIKYKKQTKTSTEESNIEGSYAFTVDNNLKVSKINKERSKLKIELETGEPVADKILRIENK